jgi:hypothetical protein
MKINEKIEYLQDNHFSDWLNQRVIVFDKLSDRQSMFCICGRLATGLHETNCRKFNNKVNAETVKQLSHLLVKMGVVK